MNSDSLADAAYRVLKREIIHCTLEPGTQVTEIQLADAYGLGRAAVRSALGRLVHQRLVQVQPRQGYIVAPVTMKDVRDLFTFRMLVEPAAARMAAGRADPQQLRRLDELCRTSYEPSNRDSIERFLEANTEFHVTIARASGNDRLAEALAGLFEELERLFHLGLKFCDRNDEMFHEHHDLIEALLAGDGDRAERIAAEQIRAAQKMVFNALLSSPSLDSVNLAVVPTAGAVTKRTRKQA